MNETQEEILARLVRIESKLSAFMEASGFNTHGLPLKKAQADHPETLFKARPVVTHSAGYLTRN
jgi:hypothetical protein